MSQIKIEKLNVEQKKQFKIPDQPESDENWSVWECEPATFDWHYDQTEKAYIYEGAVNVKTGDGEVQIKKGDFVTFSAGLTCTWNVTEKIRKVYAFE